MKARLLVAAVGVPLLLVILLVLPVYATAAAIAFLSAVAARELLKTTGLLQKEYMIVEAMVMAVLVAFWCWLGRPVRIGVTVALVFFLLEFTEAVIVFPQVKFEAVLAAMFAGIVIPLCLGSIVMIQRQGRAMSLIPLMIPLVADAGGYFAGRFLGKHKLSPILSPKKTVEGAIGGLAAGVLSMMIFGLVMQLAFGKDFNYLNAAIIGLLGSIVSIVGDLSFSMVKRETGIKDYGTIFRAHGGVLDRFDSAVFAAPLVEILLLYLPVY